jgi:hypothetical protein
MNSTQVSVLEQANKVGFGSLLESKNGRGLETKIGLEVLGNLTDQSLEGGLTDEQIGTLLVLADFAKSNSSRAIAMRLLDTSSGGG